MAHEIQDIPLTHLVEPFLVLRPVHRETVEYLELRDGIERVGLLSSIAVRPSPRLPGKYEIVTGNYRFAIATELGWDTIPCIVKHGVTDDDVLALQVQENALRPTTTPLEFSRQLKRIFDRQPSMSIASLSRVVGKSAAWVRVRLNLLALSKPIQLMVDRGEIPIKSAYMLAKVPAQYRDGIVQHALVMSPAKFSSVAASIIKQFAECVHKGKMDDRYLPKYEPVPYLRTLKELKAELKKPEATALVLLAEGCTTINDAWQACLKWALHLDSQSVREQLDASNSRFQRQLEERAAEDLDDD